MNALNRYQLKRRPSTVATAPFRTIVRNRIPAPLDWAHVQRRLTEHIEAAGVRVESRNLPPETTGIFDGLSVTTNSACDAETQCHNLGHSFGHIVQWALNRKECEVLYDALYAAKAGQGDDRTALDAALAAFRAYEEEASQYAAWLLIDTGNSIALPSFNLFARADIEAIITYHRHGVAPVWKTFFADWQHRYIRGEFELHPFLPKPIPPFAPVSIAPQEVIQGTG